MKAIALATVILSVMVLAASVSAQSDLLVETLLNQNPDPAEPGKYVELRFKVEKLGVGTLNDIQYFLDVKYPFLFDKSDIPERNIGSWEGTSKENEFQILFYKVLVDDDALEGTYDVVLNSQVGNTGIWIGEDFEIRVGEREKPKFIIGQLSTSPAKLASDLEEAELMLELTNIGDGDAENVVAEIELPEGFTPSYSYSDREALGTIAAGSSKTATFVIDTGKELAGGIHSAVLHITYSEPTDENNELKETTLDVELPLKDKALFEIVSVATVPEIVSPGTEAELRLTVRNVGGEEADSVSVRIFKDSSQPLELVEKSDFIGKLKPSEEGEAVLKIEIDPEAPPKKYTLDVEIRSIDETEVLIQDRTIQFAVNGRQSEGMTGAFVFGGMSALEFLISIALLAIIGYGSYSIGKKRGSMKKK